MHSSQPMMIDRSPQTKQQFLQRSFNLPESSQLNLYSKHSSQENSKRQSHLEEVPRIKQVLSRTALALNNLTTDICQQQKLLLAYREKIDVFDDQIFTLAKKKIGLIGQIEQQRLLSNEQSQLAIPYLQLELDIKTKRIQTLERSKKPAKQVMVGLQEQLKGLREYERMLIEEEISLRQQLQAMRKCKRGELDHR